MVPYVRVASPGMSAPRPLADPDRGAPGPRGACPSVRRPLPAGDGLLARLRIAGRALSTADLRAVAAAAERHGSGVVEFTSRANLQVRGLGEEDVAGLLDDLAAAGLVPPDAGDEVQADVVAAPAAGFDPTEVADVRPVAGALREALTAAALHGHALHPKTGVVLDGGGAVTARGLAADLAFGAVRRPAGDVAFEVALGTGLTTGRPGRGGTLVPIVTSGRVAALAARLVVLAASDGATHARLRDVVAAHGLHAVLGEVADLVDWADPAGLDRATPDPGPHLGVRPGRDRHVLVGALPPLGRLDAAGLRQLAEALEVHGAGRFVLTAQRGLLVPGMPIGPADGLSEALSRLGFVVDGTDPAGGVVACAGRPGCAAAHADTKADGRRVVERLRAAGTGRAPTVHVSGCAKRCASRRPHDVTLVAGPDGYDLLLRDPADDAEGADTGTATGERLVAGGLTLAAALDRAAAAAAIDGGAR